MIRIRNASKHYDSFRAVHDVSVEVQPGETLVLLGTSGSGKTTTLKLINRLVELSAGSIEVAGTDIRRQKPEELRRQIGYVIQRAGLFPHYTVRENVAVVPRLLRWDPQQTERQTHQVLTMLGLEPGVFLGKYPDELSGGEQQRVGLARALVADPPVVLMDEPFGALDPVTRTRIRQEFKKLEVLRRKTVVLVTHDVQEAFELGHRICLLDQGQVQQLGTPRDLLFRPANDFVRRFLAEQRFQLQLQVLTLHDLLPHLPPVKAPISIPIPLPGSATVLEATHILSAGIPENQILAISPSHGETPTLASLAGLMAAVEKTLQSGQA